MLTRDEERNLPRALNSLPHGTRLLVLDAFSDDHTVEFARAAGANVIERAWTTFPDARSYALSLVQTPWTLMIDADEALDDALRDGIVAASGSTEGYVVRRTTFYCGKVLRMWRSEPLLRLFRTGSARLQCHGAAVAQAPLHEYWVVDGATAELPGTLLHYSYPDAASYRMKYERYTAVEGAAQGFSAARAAWEWFAMWPRFAWLLLRKGAILDGWSGIVVAFWSARYRYAAARKAR